MRSAGVFFGAQQLFIRSLGDPPQVSDGVRCISRQLGLHSTAVGVLPASAPPRLPPPVRPPPLPCSSGHAALSTRRRRCTTSWWTCLSATTRLDRSEDLPEPERRSFFAALSLPLFFPAVCHLWISSLMLPRLTTQSYLCRYAVTHPSTRQRWRPTASSSACPPPLPPVQRMRLREWAAAAGCSWSALDQRTRHANTRGKKKLVRAAGRLRDQLGAQTAMFIKCTLRMLHMATHHAPYQHHASSVGCPAHGQGRASTRFEAIAALFQGHAVPRAARRRPGC